MNGMTAIDLGIAWQEFLTLCALFAIRPLVMVGVLPATDEPILTTTSRFQFSLVLAAFAAAGAPTAAVKSLDLWTIVTLVMREAFIGMVMGMVAGKVFWVAQSVGALVDNLAGYNNVQLLNPSSPEQSTPLADLMLQLSAAVFFLLGGLMFIAGAVYESWTWWPVLQSTPAWPGWPVRNVGSGMDAMMSLVASAALPILFLLTIVDLALGLVSRAAKGVDTAPVATPLKAATALLALMLFASVFMKEIMGEFDLGDVFLFIRSSGARP
ncbi:MAG: EscT/YscT/HrcT family type III secretion system export apparatus protein [Comamonadaceae bacterium]|nr:MAG: EscT/YscT/HrcT family type III secretion system export apparatus protein [Comamonadaceae bacterium]